MKKKNVTSTKSDDQLRMFEATVLLEDMKAQTDRTTRIGEQRLALVTQFNELTDKLHDRSARTLLAALDALLTAEKSK